MEKLNLLFLFIFVAIFSLLSSCAVVGGVFEMGMVFGFLLVAAIIIIITILAIRVGKGE